MFQKIESEDLGNAFKLIGRDWMLITAKAGDELNTMTASWGGMGHLWNRDVVYIFIRPQRHTLNFVEKSDNFTLTFFPEKYRNDLTYLGTVSGRDEDKIGETSLTPVTEGEFPYFEESDVVIKCKKIYKQRLDRECFLDPSIEKNYDNDYHYMYIGEVVEVLKKEA
ncbi:flavin reductase [Propionigenium maris DSM 9537]|jgi:flavin reductase (DIM6/NTAB) family NADH-FMN oxidoreductase RutF|uniref:Flavin reductase n=1 Tax=Propionigenium maris DSM 9537 TaxID=1123000 RepID=A0A9W6GLE4_9FUSO|nr:flavin reductase family protein [Propionigenium maris]GLI55722.1 flavin reductase [Propionigenium maris DSM 9537]